MVDSLDAKLDEVARQYDELNDELARPETVQDLDLLKRLGQELARLEPVVEAYRRLLDLRSERAGAIELRDGESDEEMRRMAQDEIERLTAHEVELVDELKVLLLPRDPADDGNVILEIRAGAGGDEAALFAGELLQMYLRYASNHRYKAEVMSLNETGIGGVKEAIVEIAGDFLSFLFPYTSKFGSQGFGHRIKLWKLALVERRPARSAMLWHISSQRFIP